MYRKLEPKLLTLLREGYTAKQFQGDLLGGLTVGIVALPLAIALAIASGVKPEQGLYTAIFAGSVIAVLGGTARGDILAALLTYRLIYNIVPFALSAVALACVPGGRPSSTVDNGE